jgi:peptidoglycan/LPS O-acetylase OafA/YrhL
VAAAAFVARIGRRGGIRLSEVTSSRENNFDVLRLFAAGLVLGGHSFPLSGRHDPFAPHTLGTVGVEIFFAISGFLVTRSWLSDPSLRSYLKKRILRIIPGLVCAVLVTGLVIGTAFTTQSRLSFLGARSTWAWIVSNSTLRTDDILQTVFATNPNRAANGSLWTLPVEARAYLVVAALGLIGLLRGRVIAVAALALMAVNGLAVSAGIHVGPSAQVFSLFVGGSALYLLRERVVLRWDIAALLFLAWIVNFETRLATAVGIVAVPYVVACLAYRTPRGLRRLVAKGDVSYGVYVYAFPVQQGVVALLRPIDPFVLLAIAAPVTWLLGFASWRVVEKPMLKLKRRGSPPRGRALPAPAPTSNAP